MANDPMNPAPPPPVVGNPVVVLESHEKALAALRAGLIDLEASPSYLMLTSDELGSSTASKVGAAAEDAAELWPLLEAAGGAVTHIRELVDRSGVQGAEGRQVRRLLSERWITLPVAGSRALSLQELLNDIRRRYDAIQPLVAEVDELWRGILPRIEAAQTTLARLGTEVDRLGIPEPLIGRAKAQADDLGERLIADPLAVVTADGDRLDAMVAEAAGHVSGLLASHASLDDDLARTEEQLAALRLLRARAAAAGDRARFRITGDDSVVRVPAEHVLDGPGGLAEQLDEVLLPDRDLTWTQRRALLDGWRRTADRLHGQLERALAANEAPLQRRDELRGLLRAYQAKVAATGRAEDLALTAVVDTARAELYTAPTDLAQAASAIEELARSLRS
ncbi:MAG: hypothetical protein AAGD35_23140 [Actinomycetota bacterium]